MHKLYKKADALSGEIIGAAIEVHREKGPGLLEEIYERCLGKELELRSISFKTQVVVPVEYKGMSIDYQLRLDMFVEECLIVENKAVERILPIHKAQLLSYMKLMDIPVGLLLNFNELSMKKGIHRMILPGANVQDSKQ